MSRMVIHDIVIPIVERIMQQHRLYGRLHRPIIHDPNLEEFLEEEMRRRFGVIGANDCQHLKEQLEEAKKNDPYAFKYLVERLLKKYVKLSTEIRRAERSKRILEGPPDRFSKLRKKYNSPYKM